MKRLLLGAIAVVACPCTYLLYFAVLGETALGGALAAYRGWLVFGLTVVFVAAVSTIVLRLVRSASPARAGSPPAKHAHDVNREQQSEERLGVVSEPTLR